MAKVKSTKNLESTGGCEKPILSFDYLNRLDYIKGFAEGYVSSLLKVEEFPKGLESIYDVVREILENESRERVKQVKED